MTDKQYIYIIQEVLQNDIMYISYNYERAIIEYQRLNKQFRNNPYYSDLPPNPMILRKYEIDQVWNHITDVVITPTQEEIDNAFPRYNKFGDEVDY